MDVKDVIEGFDIGTSLYSIITHWVTHQSFSMVTYLKLQNLLRMTLALLKRFTLHFDCQYSYCQQ